MKHWWWNSLPPYITLCSQNIHFYYCTRHPAGLILPKCFFRMTDSCSEILVMAGLFHTLHTTFNHIFWSKQ